MTIERNKPVIRICLCVMSAMLTALCVRAGPNPGTGQVRAQQYAEAQWDVFYRGVELPPAPWHLYRSDTGTVRLPAIPNTLAAIRDGRLFLADMGDADHLFYRYPWKMGPDDRIVVEARMRLVSGWNAIVTANGRYVEMLYFYPDRMHLRYSGLSHNLDTTADFRSYRIVMQGASVKVYVDDELRLDGDRSLEIFDNATQLSFGGADNATLAEAHWEYVRFRREETAAGET